MVRSTPGASKKGCVSNHGHALRRLGRRLVEARAPARARTDVRGRDRSNKASRRGARRVVFRGGALRSRVHERASSYSVAAVSGVETGSTRDATLTGSRTVKRDPSPSRLSTLTLPPCKSITILTRYNPTPVPTLPE